MFIIDIIDVQNEIFSAIHFSLRFLHLTQLYNNEVHACASEHCYISMTTFVIMLTSRIELFMNFQLSPNLCNCKHVSLSKEH